MRSTNQHEYFQHQFHPLFLSMELTKDQAYQANLGEGFIEHRKLQPGIDCFYLDICLEKSQRFQLSHPTKQYVYWIIINLRPEFSLSSIIHQAQAARFDDILFTAQEKAIFFLPPENDLKLLFIRLEHSFFEYSLSNNLSAKIRNMDQLYFFNSINLGIESMLQNLSWSNPNNSASHLVYLQINILKTCEAIFNSLFKVQSTTPKKVSKREQDTITRIKRYIAENLTDFPTIPNIARHVSISESKLKRLFKKVVNKSIYQYGQEQRIQYAKKLLDTGNYNIKETAYAVGYSNTSHFSTAFRKHFHQLPSEYIASTT